MPSTSSIFGMNAIGASSISRRSGGSAFPITIELSRDYLDDTEGLHKSLFDVDDHNEALVNQSTRLYPTLDSNNLFLSRRDGPVNTPPV